jgi:hypothetical protein
LIIALIPWSVRNDRAYGSLSPMAHNGGIVLSQIYNVDNPSGDMWIAPFVNTADPAEIWRAYDAEATRRLGHALSPPAVDRYWRDQALDFMRGHPTRVLHDMSHKLGLWLASTEVPSTRSDVEERMFSPIVRYLPPPGIWLLALGVAGLAWLARSDRRWRIVALPIAVAFLSAIVFFSESRFRFHAASMLALCSGVWVDQLFTTRRALLRWPASLYVGLALVIAGTSLVLGLLIPTPAIRWESIAWGYIRMGDAKNANTILDRESARQPDNAALVAAQGYLFAAQKHYADAAAKLQHAVELRPRLDLAHYNLARVYVQLGDHQRALAEARIADELNPSPEDDALLKQLSSE